VVVIGSAGALVIWALRRQLPESPCWLARRGRVAEAEAIMTRIETKVEKECGYKLAAPVPPSPS
jgi:putative MFS transporter